MGNGSVIQAVGGRCGQNRIDRTTTGRFAKDGHVVGVTPVIIDVVPHPGQRHDLVAEAVGCRSGQVVVVLRQIEKTKYAKPIVDSNHHNVALGSKNRAVVVITGANVVGAAMNPEQHRPGAIVRCRCVDVHSQTVFAEWLR